MVGPAWFVPQQSMVWALFSGFFSLKEGLHLLRLYHHHHQGWPGSRELEQQDTSTVCTQSWTLLKIILGEFRAKASVGVWQIMRISVWTKVKKTNILFLFICVAMMCYEGGLLLKRRGLLFLQKQECVSLSSLPRSLSRQLTEYTQHTHTHIHAQFVFIFIIILVIYKYFYNKNLY